MPCFHVLISTRFVHNWVRDRSVIGSRSKRNIFVHETWGLDLHHRIYYCKVFDNFSNVVRCSETDSGVAYIHIFRHMYIRANVFKLIEC
jgi:hypothetical protein